MGRGNSNGRDRERGFAAMDPEERRAIARKGGEAVSEDRRHMSEIGRRGGEASAQARSSRGGGGSGRGGSGGGGRS
jgi:uncharacterized protein